MYKVNHAVISEHKDRFDEYNEAIFITQNKADKRRLCQQRLSVLRQIEQIEKERLSTVTELAPASPALVKRGRRAGIVFSNT